MMKIYSVHDSKVEAFMQPFFMQTKGQAIRAFTDECNNSSSQIYLHPEDYTLFEIGEFEESKGIITSYNPISIGLAIEFKKVV